VAGVWFVFMKTFLTPAPTSAIRPFPPVSVFFTVKEQSILASIAWKE
jgi:hypothetical protein